MDEYLAIVKTFGGDYAPKGWAFCNGQTLAIAQNQALFSLLGTIYGGNGTTTFNLPDLRGRVCMGAGQGGGLSARTLGQVVGLENVTLQSAQIPTHTHAVTGTVTPLCSTDTGDTNNPTGSVAASTGSRKNYSTTSDSTRIVGSTGSTGGSQPFSVVQPYLAVNFIICLQGLFPSRN